MLIPKYWCGSPLSILIKRSLQDDGWFIPTKTGSKRLSVTNFKGFYESKIRQGFGINERFANLSEVDVFAHKNDVCLCIEIKTRMYARIRLETNNYTILYDSLHSRYHFDRYPEAIDAILKLRKNPTLADDRHETIKSSCELLRYCLGLIQAGYARKNCFIVVLMPFYAKEVEFKTVKECLDRLRNYVSQVYEFDIPMAIWKITTDHLDYEVPEDVWIEEVYQQRRFSISPPSINNEHLQHSLLYWRKYKNWRKCGECKYRSFCEQKLRGS